MYYKCCVDNCQSKRKDVKLHQFPASEIGLHKWLQCINSDRLRNLSIQELRRVFVCHKHFERKFITEKSRIRLGAYPTLFSEEEIRSGLPSVAHADENIGFIPRNLCAFWQRPPPENMKFDHCYSRRQHEDHTYYCKPGPSNIMSLEASGSSLEQPPVLQEIQNLPHLHTPSSSHEQLSQPLIGEVQNLPQQPMAGPSHEQLSQPLIGEVQNLPQQPMAGSSHEQLSQPLILGEVQNLSQQPVAVSDINTGTAKQRRKRVIARVADLPASCRSIYTHYKKSRRQLTFMKRAKKAFHLSKSEAFENLTRNMNPLAKRIINLQISQSEKKLRGRRFTEEEKMISLCILKQSPKTYNFLRKIFILPSRNTLNKMLSTLDVQPGINKHIFGAIKEEVAGWTEQKKYCSVIFDEVSLEPGIQLDKGKDNINGLVHLKKKTNQFADHALAFMIRGAIHKWQQPIAFYFCEGSTKKDEMKIILKEIINSLIDTGLIPVAIICDQGQSFQSAIKGLLEDSRRDQIKAGGNPTDDVITLKGMNLSVFFDPPHLIKGIRNNFLTKDIIYDGKISTWSDIVDAYKSDCKHAEMRFLHKLNDSHVIPEKISKMKVKNCTRVLSKTVASYLDHIADFSHYADGTPVSQTIKNTAETVLFFDKLFDSTNGATMQSKKTRGKELKKAVNANSPHHAFWREAVIKLQKIKYLDGKRGEVSVPSLKNWVVTLKSYMRLWQFFSKKNIKIMRPRYFNSDPIENFFGQVRAYNFRNTAPTCHTFQTTFKALLITRFIKFHSTDFNCEDDSAQQLLKLKHLFQSRDAEAEPGTSTSSHIPSNDENYTQINTETIEVQARREKFSVHSRAYTAGWLVRKILQKIKCAECSSNLTTTEGSIHSWISRREYDSTVKKRLTYPSEYAVRSFGIIVKESNEYLEKSPHVNSITKQIKEHILSKYSFDFLSCESHKDIVLQYFLSIVIKLTVFNWCGTINKILRGTDISRLNKTLPFMQRRAVEKYKKKLKNKK